VNDIERLTGKKLSFFQKLQLKLILEKLKKRNVGEPTKKQLNQGMWSMILGIGSIVFIFFPFIGMIAVPMAIAAVVLGIISLKGNSNTQAIVGRICYPVFIVGRYHVGSFRSRRILRVNKGICM
jgi:hypothetical protein